MQCDSSNCISTDFSGIQLFGCETENSKQWLKQDRSLLFSYVMRSVVAGIALVALDVRAKMSAILLAFFSRSEEGRRDKSKGQK